ncbi:hypothetical protein LguiA_024066 [Lonicera macranthoides]
MSTTTKPAVVGSSLAPSSWTLSLAQWIVSDLAPTARSSGLTTSSSVNLVLETTGPRDITLKALSSSTLFSMLFARRPRTVIVFKVFLPHFFYDDH